MPYIGKLPTTGNFIKLDTISVVNGQAAYTMQKDSVNFSPGSANQMLVSLNGIIQNPGSSFTISNHTISFASPLVTGDVINYILVLGDVLNVGTPSDGTVTNAKTNFVSTSSAAGLQIKGDGTTDGTLQLNCSQNSHGVKIASPNHAAGQSWTLKLPDNSPTADKFLKVKSITGSGATAVGQMEFASASGGLVHLGGTTASGQSSVDFTETLGHIDFTRFRRYYVRIAGVGNWGSNGSSYLAARVYVNNSVNSSNAYRYANLRHRYSSSSTSGGGAQDTHWKLFTSNYYSNPGQNISGDFTIDFSPYYVPMWAFGQSYGNTSFGAIQTTITSGAYYGHTSSQDVDGISFFMSSGTVTGRFDIYGYTNSAGGSDLGA